MFKHFVALVFSVLFSYSFVTHARYEFPPTAGTPYETVEAMYVHGSEPTDASLVGWYGGRCFRNDDPTKPLNTLFIGWMDSTQPDLGPAFAKKPVLDFILHNEGAFANPEYFDKLDRGQYGTLSRYLAGDYRRVPAHFIRHASGAVVKDPGIVPAPTISVRLYPTGRPRENYIVARSARAGELTQYCYYWIRHK